MEPTYQDIKRAYMKLVRIRETLQDLPGTDSDVRETLAECEAALQTTSPGAIRKHSADGMFRATAVDKRHGTDVSSDFATAMNLIPDHVDHEDIDRMWDESAQVYRGSIDDLADQLLDDDDRE